MAKRTSLEEREAKRAQKHAGQGVRAYTGGLTHPNPAEQNTTVPTSLRMSADIGRMLDQIVGMSKLKGEKLNKGAYAESILRPALEAKAQALKKELNIT